MDKDNSASHAASEVGRDRMLFASDPQKTVICKNCGSIPIQDFVSSSTESGNPQFVCRYCNIQAQFGSCVIPCAFRALTYYNTIMGLRTIYRGRFATEIDEERRAEIDATAGRIAQEVAEQGGINLNTYTADLIEKGQEEEQLNLSTEEVPEDIGPNEFEEPLNPEQPEIEELGEERTEISTQPNYEQAEVVEED